MAADGPTAAGIRHALETRGLRIVAEAADAEAALAAASSGDPHVCVVDARLPGDGITAIVALAWQLPETPSVVLADVPNDRELFAALSAGASGYLPKGTSEDGFVRAIRAVARGEAALPRKLAKEVVDEFRARGRVQRLQRLLKQRDIDLTPRESEVLELLMAGLSTGEIAARLSITQATVRRHIFDLERKLGVPDRDSAIRLIRKALRNEHAS